MATLFDKLFNVSCDNNVAKCIKLFANNSEKDILEAFKRNECHIFRVAACEGSLDVLKLFKKTFSKKLMSEAFLSKHCSAYGWAQKNKHMKTFFWLSNNFAEECANKMDKYPTSIYYQ